MKDLTISSIPLQELTLEAYESLFAHLYIQTPFILNLSDQSEIKRKILELEILIPALAEIIKNNSNV